MRKKRVIFVVTWAIVVVGFFVPACFAAEHKQAKQIEPGVFDVPLVLPSSLESRRQEFRRDLIEGQRRLRSFAEKYGWTKLTEKPFMKQAEIYDTKNGYDQRIYELCPEAKGKPIPKTFSAGIEKDVFFSVTPEICDKNFPEGIEPDGFIKLITHELAHRLHVRILNGDEDKMGPVWFFEGFAVYAADQYVDKAPQLSDYEIWAIVDAKERGSYLKYKTVFKHFLNGRTLPQYVKLAGDEKFAEVLKAQKI